MAYVAGHKESGADQVTINMIVPHLDNWRLMCAISIADWHPWSVDDFLLQSLLRIGAADTMMVGQALFLALMVLYSPLHSGL